MGRSISPMREAKLAGSDPPAAPRLIVPMSLRLAIPRRVALQQSSPPLHQPGVILKQKEQLGKENPLNGKCASSQLSQPRGSPQKPVLLDRAGTALVPLAEMPVGNFHRVLVRNADWCFYPCGFTRVVPCGQWGLNSESGIRTLRAMLLYWMMK